MLASDVMSRPVLTVRAEDTAEQAAALLSDRRVTAAPVLDGGGDLIGIVSEGDLLRARVAAGCGAQPGVHHTVVADVMTRDVVVLSPRAGLPEVADAMLRHNVHSVPIVDDLGEMTGIVCRHDLLRAYVRTDDTLQMEVQFRLDQYADGTRRWSATVERGVVELRGTYDDEVERRVVEALARSVSGVVDVRQPAKSAPWAGDQTTVDGPARHGSASPDERGDRS
jgi:CBS domain-containing protein